MLGRNAADERLCGAFAALQRFAGGDSGALPDELPRGQLKEEQPQAPHIPCACITPPPQQGLGRLVPIRASVSVCGQVCSHFPREAEIPQPHVPIPGEEDILTLDVPVHEVVGMAVPQDIRQLPSDAQNQRLRHDFPPPPQTLNERPRVHLAVLHDNAHVQTAVFLQAFWREVQEVLLVPNNPGVAQRTQVARFCLCQGRLVCVSSGDHLQHELLPSGRRRHCRRQEAGSGSGRLPRLAHQEHRPETAAAQAPLQHVLALTQRAVAGRH